MPSLPWRNTNHRWRSLTARRRGLSSRGTTPEPTFVTTSRAKSLDESQRLRRTPCVTRHAPSRAALPPEPSCATVSGVSGTRINSRCGWGMSRLGQRSGWRGATSAICRARARRRSGAGGRPVGLVWPSVAEGPLDEPSDKPAPGARPIGSQVGPNWRCHVDRKRHCSPGRLARPGRFRRYCDGVLGVSKMRSSRDGQ
jgi:hypothetical protein